MSLELNLRLINNTGRQCCNVDNMPGAVGILAIILGSIDLLYQQS